MSERMSAGWLARAAKSMAPVLLFIVLPGTTTPCDAQRLSMARATVENDFLSIRVGEPPDRDYSSGLRLQLAFRVNASNRSVCAADMGAACIFVRLGLGQEIYTPRRDSFEPIRGERPYAAWLYGEGAVVRAKARRTSEVGLQMGTIGGRALGEAVQNGFHRMVGSRTLVGWRHQIEVDRAFVVSYAESVLLGPILRSPELRLRPHARLSLGNVERSLSIGGVAMFGTVHDETIPDVSDGWDWWAQVGVTASWKPHDVFLAAAASQRAGPVQRNQFAGLGFVAVGYRYRHWSLEYRFSARAQEYATQQVPHKYGAVVLTLYP